MTRSFLFFCILFSGISAGYSQQVAKDSLSIEDGFFGMTYMQGDHELSSREFKQLLKTNPDNTIYQRYSSGSTLSTFGDVFGFVGGFGLGYGLFSKPTNTTSIVIGGIAAVAGLVFDITGKNKMREAVGQYNQQLEETRSTSLLYQISQRNTLVSIAV